MSDKPQKDSEQKVEEGDEPVPGPEELEKKQQEPVPKLQEQQPSIRIKIIPLLVHEQNLPSDNLK